jgi:hypothetical protein
MHSHLCVLALELAEFITRRSMLQVASVHLQGYWQDVSLAPWPSSNPTGKTPAVERLRERGLQASVADREMNMGGELPWFSVQCGQRVASSSYVQVTGMRFISQQIFQHNLLSLGVESQHVPRHPQRKKVHSCHKQIPHTALSLLTFGEGVDEAPADMWSPVSKILFVHIT